MIQMQTTGAAGAAERGTALLARPEVKQPAVPAGPETSMAAEEMARQLLTQEAKDWATVAAAAELAKRAITAAKAQRGS
ncbi:MAG: hypothetical protein DA408_11440 [Bacteroidetes bacterium]|nr:MAG: hypothetical protein C7N36_14950 [Bacteroidota bacterium]PTM12198.1 MAG: hypothetical protein DA408_11440 [Bacteroidota bacterium]